MPTHKLEFDSSSSSSDEDDAPPPAKRACPECEARRLAETPQAPQPTPPPCDEDLLDGTTSATLAAHSPDTNTAKYLRSLMSTMRPNIEQEIAHAETAFTSSVVEAARAAARGRRR